MLTAFIRDILGRILGGENTFREASALLASRDFPDETVRQRLPDYLRSRSWEVRNVGVKLIARLRDPSFYPVLVSKLLSGTDAGIVTRNVITAIGEVGLSTPEVERGLRRALKANYWEVRCEAARVLSELFEPTPERIALLVQMLAPRPHVHNPVSFGERNFEVRAAVARALGRCGPPAIALPVLRLLAQDAHWMVRHQAAVALVELSARNPDVAPEAASALDSVDVLSDGCQSRFPFPATVVSLRKIIFNGLAHTDAADIRRFYIDIRRGWNRARPMEARDKTSN